MSDNCNEDSLEKGRPDPPSGRNQIENNKHRSSLQLPRSPEPSLDNDTSTEDDSAGEDDSRNNLPVNNDLNPDQSVSASTTLTTTTDHPTPTTGTHPSRWCLSFDQIVSIDKELRKKYGKKYRTKSMHDVNNDWIKPQCNEHGTSIALHLNPQGLEIDVFVTHCWAEPVKKFFKSIINEYKGKAKKPNFWICSFAIAQGDDAFIEDLIGEDLQNSPFIQALQQANEFLVVRNKKEDLYGRIWCVCELIEANRIGLVPDQTRITGSNKFSNETSDIYAANASKREDKTRILKYLFDNAEESEQRKLHDFVQQFRRHDEPNNEKNKVSMRKILGCFVQRFRRHGEQTNEKNMVSIAFITCCFIFVAVAGIIAFAIVFSRRGTQTPAPTPTAPMLKKWIQSENNMDGLKEGDEFGFSVAMSSLHDIVAVGAPGGGSTQVYQLNSSTNTWNLFGESLHGSATDREDGFGTATSICKDGIVIAIGALYKNNHTGSTYIYSVNNSANKIQFVQELEGDNNGDELGTSVDVSDDCSTIVVGALKGYVRVYSKKANEVTWSPIGNTITGKSTDDNFGASVSSSKNGDVIAVGAPHGNYAKIVQYDKSINKWVDYGNNVDSVLSGDNVNDQFGASVSLSSSANIVAISSPNSHGVNGNKTQCGTVKVFEINPNTKSWELLGRNIDGANEGDLSGGFQGLELSDQGRVLAIGSSYNDGNNKIDSGSVRIFEYDSANKEWIQTSQDIYGEEEHDRFGFSIALAGDGSMVAVGAFWNDGNGHNSGRVQVYRRKG